MSNQLFINTYLEDFSQLIKPNEEINAKLLQVHNYLLDIKNNNKKVLIFGNGGSAAISSHFSVDITKNAKIRCLNFNESDLITCFSNDYGFEYWAEKAIDFYGDQGDMLIAISSSGNSQNMINAVNAAQKGKFSSIITLSGFSNDNKLKKLGDVNLWLDSKAYNFVECAHQIWLLAIVDLLIGKREYSS